VSIPPHEGTVGPPPHMQQQALGTRLGRDLTITGNHRGTTRVAAIEAKAPIAQYSSLPSCPTVNSCFGTLASADSRVGFGQRIACQQSQRSGKAQPKMNTKSPGSRIYSRTFTQRSERNSRLRACSQPFVTASWSWTMPIPSSQSCADEAAKIQTIRSNAQILRDISK
jgi:hypothetical protein